MYVSFTSTKREAIVKIDEADAGREEGAHEDRHRQEQPREADGLAGRDDDDEERDERVEEVHERAADGRGDEDGARDVDAPRDLGGVRREGGRVRGRLREERPEDRAREEVGGIVLDLRLEDGREGDREGHHREERAQHAPDDAEDRPLVADLDVAPDELGDEVAIRPERLRLLDEEEAPPRGVVDGKGARRHRSSLAWTCRGLRTPPGGAKLRRPTHAAPRMSTTPPSAPPSGLDNAEAQARLEQALFDLEMARSVQARLEDDRAQLGHRIAALEADRASLRKRIDERQRYIDAIHSSVAWIVIQKIRALFGRKW